MFYVWKNFRNLWEKYETEVLKNKVDSDHFINISNIKVTPEAKTFEILNIKRYCCKRMFLGHKDMTK